MIKNLKAILKSFVHLLTVWVNNKQIDNANGLDVLVPMYNLIQYSDNYSKILRGLWQFCKNEADYNILNRSNSNQDLQTITVF